ncbi:uncharacterized protein [Henckelia pumila]|uniref:uncharacterized protein n=1 Tax=Henckelia pumila TaxID=405737 RepID=UPI003C6E38E7
MNKYNDYAKKMNCLYAELPEYLTWHKDSKEWEPRKKQEVIGRIFNCHPSDGEKFYLKLLLMHIRKPTSFKDLRTIKGKYFDTFREAAQYLGLMETDSTAEMCIEEAATYLMPAALRQLFATILVYCSPKNPKQLWLKFENFLSQDFEHKKTLNQYAIKHKVLDIIAYHLDSMGKKLQDFFFVDDDIVTRTHDNLFKEIQTERDIIIPTEDLLAIKQLNEEQKVAYDQILHHVNNNIPNAFFIDGPGGTGKTFLYRALLATIYSAGHIALATATSGVAASLLPGGRTSHSRFKIPIGENNSKPCSISKQSALAQLIKSTKLIIWDEATMAKRDIIEKFDEMLRDIMSSNIIFGGKIIVFGGDFRQTLHVILKGTKDDIIDSSIVMSPLWQHLHKLKLKQNMRASLDPHFSSYLLKIGDGIEYTNDKDEIQIPPQANVPFIDDNTTLNTLIDMVFPNINDENLDFSLFVNRAILTTRNDFVHEINDVLINRFPGEETTYFSCDENTYTCTIPDQEELFHSLTPQGLPPHKLTLKLNAPIILLRNINPNEGLCNGTRLLCKGFTPNIIYAEISVGVHAKKTVFTPRITLEAPHDNFSSIPFKRKQFPIRLCYAMTINKAQDQTLDFLGVYLKKLVFSHGQLYVALSRARSIEQLKVLIRPSTPLIQSTDYTKNVVYQEILKATDTH